MKISRIFMAVLLVICPSFQEVALAQQASQHVVSPDELQRHVVGNHPTGLSPSTTVVPNSGQESKRGQEIKAMVEKLGLGAEVKYIQHTGRRGSGVIEEIADETVKIATKNDTLTFDYDLLTHLSIKDTNYRAQGQIDPSKVRGVAVFLGQGKKVKMKLDSGNQLKGKIQSVEEEGFTIVRSNTSQSTSLSFGEVREISQDKFPAWGWGVIIGGALFGLLMLGAAGVIGEGIG